MFAGIEQFGKLKWIEIVVINVEAGRLQLISKRVVILNKKYIKYVNTPTRSTFDFAIIFG